MKIKLFKSLERTWNQYTLNRLEPMAEILKDEVEALDINVKLHPNSERLQNMFSIKFEEYETVIANITELKRKLKL